MSRTYHVVDTDGHILEPLVFGRTASMWLDQVNRHFDDKGTGVP
jgi:hypothetical protein